MQISNLYGSAQGGATSFGSALDPQTYIIRSVVDAMDLDPNSAVVEFGAGAGDFTLPIARRLEDFNAKGVVFGLDMSERLIDVLDQRAWEQGVENRVRAVCLSRVAQRAFPIRDHVVDRVLSVNALQYLSDPSAVYAEITRVLKPGGLLFVADWRRHGLDFVKIQGTDQTPGMILYSCDGGEGVSPEGRNGMSIRCIAAPQRIPLLRSVNRFDRSQMQSQAAFANQAKSDIIRAGLQGVQVLDQQPSYWIIRARKKN